MKLFKLIALASFLIGMSSASLLAQGDRAADQNSAGETNTDSVKAEPLIGVHKPTTLVPQSELSDYDSFSEQRIRISTCRSAFGLHAAYP